MNLKPIPENDEFTDKRARPKRRRRRLRTIAMLPTLLTLGNLYFGFLAIYYCGREMHDLGAGVSAAAVLTLKSQRWEALAPTYLSIASLMLVAAMLCDALDGRVARLTERTSRFGEQMDSLADVVSFGAAPALLMVTLVRRELFEWDYVPFGFERFGQAALLLGAVFVSFSLARTSADQGHIAVDFLVQRLPQRWQYIVEAVNAGICALLFTVIGRQCVLYSLDLKTSGEVSMTLQIPIHPFVLGIALGCAMLSIVLYAGCVSWSAKAFSSSV